MSIDFAVQLADWLTQRGYTLALAESCTGGALAARLVEIPGASRYFLGSFVVYASSWKEQFLQVSPVTLRTEGPASERAVDEMARGLLQVTRADYVLAISGILEPPEGDSRIYIALGRRGEEVKIYFFEIAASRVAAIRAAVERSLQLLWHEVARS